MITVDLIFYSLCISYAVVLVSVLYLLRREPLYDPRILFTLSASLWLLIIHGYMVDFEGYLAAMPGFYTRDKDVLSAMAIGTWLVGYIALIGGASLGVRFRYRPRSVGFDDHRVLLLVCWVFIIVAVVNFAANVVLISGGDLFHYLASFAMRPYDVKEDKGITAVGYLFGFIGVQFIAYVAGRRRRSRMLMWTLFVGVLIMLVIRFSQARIFQTLVLVGACYVCYAMGAAQRRGFHAPWLRHIHILILAAFTGIAIYFLRVASSMNELGVTITWKTAINFIGQFAHVAFERGNVPNFPVVFTILDRMPGDVDFFYGKTLFNWAIFFIPKSILKGDYLISLRIKEIWYQGIEGGGLPPTAVGEWYANFGFAGVIVGMFLVGLGLGAIYKLARIVESPFLTVLWANLVFGFVVIYPKTDLAQIPVYSIFMIACLWLMTRVVRASVGRPRGQQALLE